MISAFYYIKIVKVMYFDAPATVVTGRSDGAHWVLLAICSALMSPFGYLLNGPLGDLADRAAAALFLAA